MAADRSSTVPRHEPDDRGDEASFAGLPAYPDHFDTSPPAYLQDPMQIEDHRWARVGRIFGRAFGGLAGGLATGLDAWDRWGLLGLIIGAIGGTLILGFLIGELGAFGWGLRGRWLATWRIRRAHRRGDSLHKEEDPAWERVRALMRDKTNSDS
jgi:hypothetical protein